MIWFGFWVWILFLWLLGFGGRCGLVFLFVGSLVWWVVWLFVVVVAFLIIHRA